MTKIWKIQWTFSLRHCRIFMLMDFLLIGLYLKWPLRKPPGLILCSLGIVLKIVPLVGGSCPRPCRCDNKLLYCEGLNLTDIPQNLSSAIGLSLRENNISELREGNFVGLSQLTWLYLDHNNIEIVEENAFERLRRVKELDLSTNRIESLPNGPSDLCPICEYWIYPITDFNPWSQTFSMALGSLPIYICATMPLNSSLCGFSRIAGACNSWIWVTTSCRAWHVIHLPDSSSSLSCIWSTTSWWKSIWPISPASYPCGPSTCETIRPPLWSAPLTGPGTIWRRLTSPTMRLNTLSHTCSRVCPNLTLLCWTLINWLT